MIYGVGFMDKQVSRTDKCKIVWVNMLKRCYSEEYHSRHTYFDRGVHVCAEWLVYSNFLKWFSVQDSANKCLDKDLLVEGNKVYSPVTCCFIEDEINKFLTLRQSSRGGFPLGVNYKTPNRKFVSQITSGGKKIHLGLYKDSMEAHRAWQLAKRDRALQLQAEQTDSRVIGGLQRIIDKLQHDYDNNLETKTL